VARRLGCERVLAVPSVARACDTALADAGEDDAVLITGSLYVVGSARAHLRP
jgi:folylpolyglutamate synthase/dihydropteroate synthase